MRDVFIVGAIVGGYGVAQADNARLGPGRIIALGCVCRKGC